MMGGDVCGDWKVDYFHSMACYALKMNSSGKLWEGSNGSDDYIFPQFKAIKDPSVVLTINKIL